MLLSCLLAVEFSALLGLETVERVCRRRQGKRVLRVADQAFHTLHCWREVSYTLPPSVFIISAMQYIRLRKILFKMEESYPFKMVDSRRFFGVSVFVRDWIDLK